MICCHGFREDWGEIYNYDYLIDSKLLGNFCCCCCSSCMAWKRLFLTWWDLNTGKRVPRHQLPCQQTARQTDRHECITATHGHRAKAREGRIVRKNGHVVRDWRSWWTVGAYHETFSEISLRILRFDWFFGQLLSFRPHPYLPTPTL